MKDVRLAWFSPMPPVRTGLSVDSRALLCRLGDAHEIDVFVDDPVVAAARRLNRLPEAVAIRRRTTSPGATAARPTT